jgi:hypothetical protein
VTAAGWILLGVSWTAIGALVVFCLRRVLRAGPLGSGAGEESGGGPHDAERP